MKSRYPGTCPRCGQRYPAGTEISRVDGAWGHAECPQGRRPEQTSFASSIPSIDDAPIVPRKPFDRDKALRELYGGSVPSRWDEKPAVTGSGLQAALSQVTEEAPGATETHATEPERVFVPSAYQADLFKEIKAPTVRNIVMKAGPGSGKTTTSVHALELTPKDAKVGFLAFNKRIAKDIATRTPPHVHVSTLHSLGLSCLMKTFQRVTVDKDKTATLLDPIYPTSKRDCPDQSERSRNRVKRQAMRKLVSIAKAVMFDASDAGQVYEAVERYSIEIPEDFAEELVELLPRILDASLAMTDTIDYDDMIWMPVALKEVRCEQFDYLFVDEAQDLNTAQIRFVMKSVKPEGRVICVGDEYQSMYAFRGADAEAIPNMVKLLTAKVMRLPISYRNPKSHVRLINSVVTDNEALVQARPDAPEGIIGDVPYTELVNKLETGDMVLCRTNAPLIEPAFACIRANKKASIAGRDIGEDLIKLVENFNVDTLDALEVSLNEYFQHEYQKLLDHGKELQAAILDDKVKTLTFVMENSSSVSHLISQLRMLFSDDNIGIVFSSVHRAKGLEAERVYILKPELMPFPKAKKDWELEQERNIQYVAYSRSKSELYFVR